MQLGIKDAFRLSFDGSAALADVEAAGIHIDVPYLDSAIAKCQEQIRALDDELRGTEVYTLWRREYGERMSFQSGAQLGHIFFDCLGYKQDKKTESGDRYKTDKASFGHVDHPFIPKYFEAKELRKLKSTYLDNLKRETCNGYFHPLFNLHTATSYRSSSGADEDSTSVGGGGSINFQNLPIRNAKIGPIIRRCFIPRSGRRILEVDESSVEFKGAACFWADPAMVEYASDPNKDPHRDTAAKMFGCDTKLVSKGMRQIGKNQFVFPILYGSFYIQCATRSWFDIHEQDPKLENGVRVIDWLADQGITSLGDCDTKKRPAKDTWELRVQEVEKDFYRKFSTFAKKKEEWWNEFKTKGIVYMPTGFPIKGTYSRKFLQNAPIQGGMFHALLWSLIELNKWIWRRGLLTRIIGTIHDCILFDCPEDELQMVLTKAERVMTEQVREHFKWIITPLAVEVDCTDVDGGWNTKAPWVHDENGIWAPKKKKVLV